MSELLNSIWPNGVKKDADGYSVYYPLGTNKIDIPDGSKWPKGTKLKFPFVYDENGQLTGFCDTKSMTNPDMTWKIYLPYKEIEADFSSIDKGTLSIHAPNATIKKAIWKDGEEEDIPGAQFKYKGCKTVNNVKTVNSNYQTTDIVNGVWSEPLWDLTDANYMFQQCENITSFNSDLPSLTNGYEMFDNCSNLTSFNSDLPSLTNGTLMFQNCSSLTTFNSNLSSLTNCSSMFNNCKKLTTFFADLSSLTSGFNMFQGCSSLTSFSSDTLKLTDGYNMFCNCTGLTSFSFDLSNLTDGRTMFYGCTNLTSFSSKLSNLTNGNNMFYNCKLDATSVKNIINTINTHSSQLTLGMGCDATEADKDLFAQEVGYTDMNSLLAALQAKGWDVFAQYKGRPTTTYGLRRPSEGTLPVFVKLEETEDRANYTSLDESKKFRLDWFHETTGSTDGYTQFNSLEEAIETLNIKQIEKQ